MGRIVDRVGFGKVLIPAFLLAAITVALVGQPGVGVVVLFAAITVAGFCVVGGSPQQCTGSELLPYFASLYRGRLESWDRPLRVNPRSSRGWCVDRPWVV
jgi:hypothetical protein